MTNLIVGFCGFRSTQAEFEKLHLPTCHICIKAMTYWRGGERFFKNSVKRYPLTALELKEVIVGGQEC